MSVKYLFLLVAICFYSGVVAQEAGVITTSAENDFIPEGIAIDSRTGRIFISSISRHKIIAVGKNGRHTDFIQPGQDGFLEGLGMKVDSKRGWLWALSVKREGKTFYSKVHAFDLKSGETKQQYDLHDTVPHLFNDLVLDNKGNLLITDTYFSAVYRLKPEEKKLELLVQSPLLRYPNGIVFGGRHLYIATYQNGLVTMDTATRDIQKLGGIADTTISHGIDGLLYARGSLIGVYNIGKKQAENCLIRYHLSADGTRVEREEVLTKGHASFADPTTAALYRNAVYVIANSHLDAYNKNKESTKGIEGVLQSPRILVWKLQ